MNELVLALQAALVLVIVLVLIELVRLQRAVRAAQLSLPDMDEVRRLNHAIRESVTSAENAVRMFQEALHAEARLKTTMDQREPERNEPAVAESLESEAQAGPQPPPGHPRPESSAKRGPRVLSEAGRAKYDRVLHLAARGLDIDSIAREVDLTRAEVELMLGSVE